MKAKEIINLLNNMIPLYIQEKWDNSGFQIGSYKKDVNSILFALDINDKVIDEAIVNNIDMIITHHPFFFSSIKNINIDSNKGNIINKLIKNDLVVYSLHTNYDAVDNGVSDVLAKVLNIKDTKVLNNSMVEKLYKLAVFVPKEYADKVRSAITSKEAGWIGDYSDCTFNTIGIGTFKPKENTNPFIGKTNNLEHVEEVKIETIVKESLLDITIKAMVNAHPYEEVAYDVYKLHNSIRSYGLGRIGDLNKEETLQSFAESVKLKLSCNSVRIYGNLDKNIKRVAVCGGSGSDFITDACKMKADVFVTGDIRYHDAQEAISNGLCLIDANHYNTEKIAMTYLKDRLEKELINLKFIVSNKDNSAEYISI